MRPTTHFSGHQSSYIVYMQSKGLEATIKSQAGVITGLQLLCESSVHFAPATGIFAATKSSSIYHRSRKNQSYAHGCQLQKTAFLQRRDGYKFISLAGDCLVPKVQWDEKS